MRYVTYNPETGALTGAYLQDLNPEHAAAHLEVTEEQYAAWTGLMVQDLEAETLELVAVPGPSEADQLTAASAALVRQIDAETDALYGVVIGNRAAEYTLAETEATAFAQANYDGPAPASVASWATAKGWTAQQAADDILTTAVAWRTAQAAIRAARLLRKEQARNAADQAALAVVRAQWAGFMAAVRQQLGGV
jgi:endonuclease/exonuclease/phosphatase family metal-dependent hydrolase